MKKFNGGGSVTDNATEKIGKTGTTKGETSTGGGQYPFLPSAGSFSGRVGGSTKVGTTPSSPVKSRFNKGNERTDIPFLPPAKK